MTISHKKIAQILKHWNLSQETITDIYYEGTGNRKETACYVGQKYVLKYTCNLGKLKKNMELSRALAENGLLSALPVQTDKGEDFLREGEVYYYLTRKLAGKQMVSRSMEAKDGLFVGEILGRLHLALRNIDDCVSEADLMATLRDWALSRAKTAMDLSEWFCNVAQVPM